MKNAGVRGQTGFIIKYAKLSLDNKWSVSMRLMFIESARFHLNKVRKMLQKDCDNEDSTREEE